MRRPKFFWAASFVLTKKKTMNNLSLYGWNKELLQQKRVSNFKDHLHGRVAVTHKTCYEIIAVQGTYTCELTGNMLYGKEHEEYPCTGDWVIFQPTDGSKGIILELLPRKKTLYRQKSGATAIRQPIAAHVDKAFIVQSLDNNFNVRRIERFMLQIASENIQAALVFTKTDLGFSKVEVEKALSHISHKVPVFYTSIFAQESIAELQNFIAQGETVLFTGSSGVGKSTLINALCKKEVLPTASISSSTGKGRHTSTRREMLLLENSGVLIDTPGVKLLGVTCANPKVLSDELDISSYEKQCRYSNCQHINEKGCAVIKAVEEGLVDKGVYENFIKLRKEAWHFTASVHEKRKKERSFSKMVKNAKNSPYKKR